MRTTRSWWKLRRVSNPVSNPVKRSHYLHVTAALKFIIKITEFENDTPLRTNFS